MPSFIPTDMRLMKAASLKVKMINLRIINLFFLNKLIYLMIGEVISLPV